MVSINLKEDVLEIMCSVEMYSRGVGKEESSVCSQHIQRREWWSKKEMRKLYMKYYKACL